MVGRLLAPHAPGVYAIFDGGGHYVYVGESLDIQRRLDEHMNDPDDCIHVYGPARYAYEVHLTRKARLARQSQLAAAHPTPCNERGN